MTATLQGGVNGTNVTIATAGATAGAEDINITEGVRIAWNQESTLQLEAGNDINALTDVFIQHSGDGDVDTGGGVVLLAGNDINVGSALRDDANGNGILGVAIGSEHGSNIFVAGDSDFDQTSDKAGSVVLTGGEDLNGVISGGGFSQLGYIMGTTRSDDRNNGTIIVQAGTDVTLIGGGDNDADGVGTAGAFAQIGHGGVNIVDFTTGETIASVADISGDIQVTAGVISGDVNLSSAQGAGESDYAQIGHGALAVKWRWHE